MQKTFISFQRGQSQEVYESLSKKEKQIIDDYVKYVSITSSSQKRLENNRRTLIHFRFMVEKDFDKVNLQDLRDYLALMKASTITNASQNEYKATIKRFLRWKFKDWSERFQELQDIKLHMKMNEEKINAGTLLKKEDVEALVKHEKSTYWKAFFLTLYESGARPKEIRTLTWDKINFNVDREISEIHIFATKTHKARTVYVEQATFYLKTLKEQREDPSNPLVFPSVKDKTKPLSKDHVSHWLTRLSKRVLGRNVTPYMLRHTRATELYTNSNIPDKVAQKFMGHNKSMSDIYTHLSSKDVKEAMGKTVYKFEDLPEEKKHQLEKDVADLKGEVADLKETLSKFKEEHEKLVKIWPDFSNDVIDMFEELAELKKKNKAKK